MNQCIFVKAWIGQCTAETVDGLFCEKHADSLCRSCGSKAIQECSETMGLVCGTPLCNDCEHTLRENGCNSGAPLPEGLGDHCKKSEQVYQPWYMTESF